MLIDSPRGISIIVLDWPLARLSRTGHLVLSDVAQSLPPRKLPAPGVVLILLSWLIPGLGFMLCGRVRRGALLFAAIMLTFALGLASHGGVVWPSWSRSDESFNLMNNLIFGVQILAGLPALLSLAAAQLGLPVLGGSPEHAYFELGSYYLVAAGALNYFATTNFHDRLVRLSAKYREQELGQPAKPPQTPPSPSSGEPSRGAEVA